jgi:hypothetical protein
LHAEIKRETKMTPLIPCHPRLIFGLTTILLLCAATAQAQPDTQGTPKSKNGAPTGKDVQSGDKGRQTDAPDGDMMGGMK